MESAWRVIDCMDVEGQLRYERGRMVVCADGKESVKIPLAQTAVLLLGLRANISTALLFRLAQEGVSVLFCDWRGVPTGALDSWGSTPSRVTIRHWAQVDMSVPRQKNAWKRIVKAKIRGQARCLDMCGGNVVERFWKCPTMSRPVTPRMLRVWQPENTGRIYLILTKGFPGRPAVVSVEIACWITDTLYFEGS